MASDLRLCLYAVTCACRTYSGRLWHKMNAKVLRSIFYMLVNDKPNASMLVAMELNITERFSVHGREMVSGTTHLKWQACVVMFILSSITILANL